MAGLLLEVKSKILGGIEMSLIKDHTEYAEGIAENIIQENEDKKMKSDEVCILINERVDSYCSTNVWNTDIVNPEQDRTDTFIYMIKIVTKKLVELGFKFRGN